MTTPGQAACEAFWKAMGSGPSEQPPDAAWAWAGERAARDAWEAAAQAAIAAGTATYHDGCTAVIAGLESSRDYLRALIADIRAALLQGGQDAASVRRQAIGILERARLDGQP